jgi:adenylyltransferase/sulfurtransferase
MINCITVHDLKSRLDAGDRPYLLDVRQQEEHEEFSLEPSVLIPLNELPERVGELDDYRNKELIVYCRSGNRSQQACMFLELSGFTNVVNLTGGMLAWAQP